MTTNKDTSSWNSSNRFVFTYASNQDVDKLEDRVEDIKQQNHDIPLENGKIPASFMPSSVVQTSENGKISTDVLPTEVVTTDENGLIPSDKLPGFVDDVVEVESLPETGEAGKIYIVTSGEDINKQYRWSGSQFVQITSGDLVIGDVTGTAYDGGKGKTLEDKVTVLEGTVSGEGTDIAELEEKVTTLEGDLNSFKAEVDNKITTATEGFTTEKYVDDKVLELKSDVDAQVSEINDQLTEVNENINNQIAEVKQETTSQIDSAKEELSTQVTGVESSLNSQITEVNSHVDEVEQNLNNSNTTFESGINNLNSMISEVGESLQVGKEDKDLNLKTRNNKVMINSTYEVAKFSPYPGEEGRKVLQLNNHDSLSGISATGEGANIAMLSKRDVMDFGSTKFPMNLNALNGEVKINDEKVIATVDQVEAVKAEIPTDVVTHDELTAVDNKIPEVVNWALANNEETIPASKLPSFVDDIVEVTELPETGESGKIYLLIDGDNTDQYRWSGSQFVRIDHDGLVIGTTTGTALDGKIGTDHINNSGIHVTTSDKENWNNKLGQLDVADWAKSQNPNTIPADKVVAVKDIAEVIGESTQIGSEGSDLNLKTRNNKVMINSFGTVLYSIPYNDGELTKQVTVLNNNDNISGTTTTGQNVPLVFMSRWDKVEVGGSGAPLNLNTSSTVTINDSKEVATVDQIPSDVVTHEELTAVENKIPASSTTESDVSLGTTEKNLILQSNNRPTVQVNNLTREVSTESIAFVSDIPTEYVKPTELENYVTKEVAEKDHQTLDDKITVVTRIPIRVNLNKVYLAEDIYGWFGVEDVASLKNLFADKRLALKYGITLSTNPKYYNIPVQYAEFVDANTLHLIAIGLDTSDDTPSKYDITIKLDGTLVTETSNIKVDIIPLDSEVDLSEVTSSIESLQSKITEVESSIPSVEGLATEEFVTGQVDNLNSKITEVEGKIPSLDGYATTQNVSDSIAAEASAREKSIEVATSDLVHNTRMVAGKSLEADVTIASSDLTDGSDLAKTTDVTALDTKVFGGLDTSKFENNPTMTCQVVKLDDSYTGDLGLPETINGQPYDESTNKINTSLNYLVCGYFDEGFTFHYDAWDSLHLPIIFKTFTSAIGLTNTSVDNKVPKTTKVAGHALSEDVAISSTDLTDGSSLVNNESLATTLEDYAKKDEILDTIVDENRNETLRQSLTTRTYLPVERQTDVTNKSESAIFSEYFNAKVTDRASLRTYIKPNMAYISYHLESLGMKIYQYYKLPITFADIPDEGDIKVVAMGPDLNNDNLFTKFTFTITLNGDASSVHIEKKVLES